VISIVALTPTPPLPSSLSVNALQITALHPAALLQREIAILTILKCTGGPPNAVKPRYHPCDRTSQKDFAAPWRLHLEVIAIALTFN